MGPVPPGTYDKSSTPKVFFLGVDSKDNGFSFQVAGDKPGQKVTISSSSQTAIDGSFDFADNEGNTIKGAFSAKAPPKK